MAKTKTPKMTKTALREEIERADKKYSWRHYQEFLDNDEFGYKPYVVAARTRHYANGYMNALYEFFEKYIPIGDEYLDRNPITKKSLLDAVKLADKEVARIYALQRVHPKTEFYADGYRDALWHLGHVFFPDKPKPRKRQKVKTSTKRTAKKKTTAKKTTAKTRAKKASKNSTKKTAGRKRAPR